MPIVLNRYFQEIPGHFSLHLDFRRRGVPKDVGQCLLHDQKNIVPHFRRQSPRGQIVWKIKATSRRGIGEQFIGEMSDVFDKTLQ